MRARRGIPRWLRAGWTLVAVGIVALAVLGPLLAPHAPTTPVGPPFRGPTAAYPLGTDVVGRDVLSRVLHGGAALLALAGLALLVSNLAGVALGLLAGLRRGADRWISRPVDAIVVVPWFLLLAVIATALGAGPLAVVVTVTLASVPWIVRIVRTVVLEVADTGYVESARARGEPLWWIAVVEVLPNLRAVVLADAGVRLSMTISMVAVSGFLGLGLRPPSPDWALMITENRPGFGIQPWAVLAPALLVMALVVSVNMITDRGLRESARGRWAPRTGDHDGLRIERLSVRDDEGRALLGEVSIRVPGGRGLAVVGPSGAGKTTLLLAVLGELPAGLHAEGTVSVARGESGRRRLGYVPQDPASGLDPSMRIGTAVAEIARSHGGGVSVEEALRRVELPGDRRFRRRYPHQLSGGQQQRVLLAMALLGEPSVVVLDEPTTGLDARTRDGLVVTLARLREETAMTLLVVTHDLDAVAALVDEVVELEGGRVVSGPASDVESGSGATVSELVVSDVGTSRTSGGREISAGTPGMVGPDRPAATGPVESARSTSGRPVLEVDALTAGHGYGRRFRPVVTDLSFAVRPGECLALVGDSGAGKTTVARVLAGLHPLARGRLALDGIALPADAGRRTRAQRRDIQIVFQNPATSLNPAHRVGAQIAGPLRSLRGMGSDEAAVETARLLTAMGLDPALAGRRPGRLSGGQQQRVALARALAAGPRILICDEITASLDAVSRAAVLDVLAQRRRKGLALILISHQPEVLARLADRRLVVGADPALDAVTVGAVP